MIGEVKVNVIQSEKDKGKEKKKRGGIGGCRNGV